MRKFILIITLFFSLLAMGSSNAFCDDIVRVGISPTDFSVLEYSSASISAVDEYVVYDKVTQEEIFTGSCGVYVDFDVEDGGITVSSNGVVYKRGIRNPIGIKSKAFSKDNQFTVKNLKRKGKQAFYHGEFEVSFPKPTSQKFSLINILPLEEYLKGVVPNEMPVRFGLEALKAQAVAARNYTMSSNTKLYYNFDVCDSVKCQVYFGAATQSSLSDQAVEETKGLYAIYDKELILALYSSTAGGFTESHHNAFPGESNKLPSDEVIPYLTGRPDIESSCPRDLSDDEDAEDFYVNCPNSYDIYSPNYRWTRSWTKEEMQKVLSDNLPKAGVFVEPQLPVNVDIGNLVDIKVLKRGVSGKVITLEIVTSNGSFFLSKELTIRRTFTKDGSALPSANIVFKNVYDEEGNLSEIKVFGGGYGHGVGMSQYGAGFMAMQGDSFDEILQHYYTGISIGTRPAFVSVDEKLDLQFVAPKKRGYLFIDNPDGVSHLSFRINGSDHEIKLKRRMKIDISRLIKDFNIVSFWALDSSERDKKVKVWIEIFEAEDE